MIILGIETSCDETSAAVVKNGVVVLSNIIASQIDVHKIFGGVVPEIASRKHIENIGRVVEAALTEAGVDKKNIDAVAVTSAPGLVGALIVGVSYAKGLCFGLKKPIIGVNHIKGHICANFLESGTGAAEPVDYKLTGVAPPFLCLVVSGGHTHLVYVKDYDEYTVMGRTRDDAAGEAFDKTARALGLSYPGGPAIEKVAKDGDPYAINFPIADIVGYDFSFSGLKSAVLNYINKQRMQGVEYNINDVASSFQHAVITALTQKAMAACEQLGAKRFALAGGVASNGPLRAAMRVACAECGVDFFVPLPVYCTDNAAMIASCGYYLYKSGKQSGFDLNAADAGDL
ncbi:MAG: tRNA (adenosine(37)-N6)-threonylcarbamoyltransferase complex transferase subunit TsaD [Clostridiales bacterium]|jgi:N6-L-threonylcarbamoyladenine synthase|nr:tRNA (adenosine(37)-N6)-threonylcarbamoyltransferase complex transferase subunit TsaD [Clostridiales bacterium]